MDRRMWHSLRDALPAGRTLPEADWARRHRALLRLLWVHAVAVPVYSLLRGYDVFHALMHSLPLVGFALLSMRGTWNRRTSAVFVSVGLLTGAALAVHASHGLIEAHFHFFVLIVVLTLYEDWLPFLTSVAYVVLHHGLLGVIDHDAVFDHPGDPWLWALIHGAFVAAAGVGAIVSWRLNEDVRTKAGEVEELFLSAFDDASIGMAVVDLDGKWLQVNRALAELTGYPIDELLEMRFRDITHPEDVDADLVALRRLVSGDIQRYATEKRYIHADGHEVWIALSVSAVMGPAGPRYFIAQMQDITERRRAEAELAHQAMHDALTGLPNRALLVDRLEVALARLERRPWPLAVMFVDLDRFKLVNDSLGHAAGDAVLVEVANRLRSAVRPADTVARFAGDEFTILCEDVMDDDEATRIAARVADSLREPVLVDGRQLFITASIGISVARTGADADVLLHEADAAMYRAKEHAASRFALFREGMRPVASDRLELEGALRHAVERDELRLHYQPEICLDTGRVVGLEALVRWEHPTRGLLGPDQFIPAAEETGLIVPLGSWVLREACAQLARWREAGDVAADVRVAVNVSARQLAEPEMVAIVEDALSRSGLEPDQLCLEVTESAVMDGVGPALDTLRLLKALGVALAIDDFGVGFSSLTRLKELPAIDLVKIDRTFVAGLIADGCDAAIVSSVINLAQSLNVAAVAEGVETADQASALRVLGCHMAQGFHFSRPQPPEALTGAMRALAEAAA